VALYLARHRGRVDCQRAGAPRLELLDDGAGEAACRREPVERCERVDCGRDLGRRNGLRQAARGDERDDVGELRRGDGPLVRNRGDTAAGEIVEDGLNLRRDGGAVDRVGRSADGLEALEHRADEEGLRAVEPGALAEDGLGFGDGLGLDRARRAPGRDERDDVPELRRRDRRFARDRDDATSREAVEHLLHDARNGRAVHGVRVGAERVQALEDGALEWRPERAVEPVRLPEARLGGLQGFGIGRSAVEGRDPLGDDLDQVGEQGVGNG
jgi:hypothetical protein